MYYQKKSASLYVVLLLLWIPTIALICSTLTSWLDLLILLPLLYAQYYLLAFLFSIRIKDKYVLPSVGNIRKQSIALLMTVCNDFDESAAESLTKQTYPNYHVFILDDSDVEIERQKVHQWCSGHSPICTHLWRNTRRGYKAGNLNDSHKKIPQKFQLLCILDSDQVLPPSYLETLYGTYVAYGCPSFVQGVHEGRKGNISSFSLSLSDSVSARGRYLLYYKNRYGLPIILGHGYLIERKVLSDIGGVPEIVSEDLALSMELHRHGHIGIIAPNVISEEAYPASVTSLQKRRFRWTMADWEIVFSHHFIDFLKTPAHLIEKIDLTLREIRLPLSSCYFAMVFAVLVACLVFKDLHPSFWGTFLTKQRDWKSLSLLFAFSPLFPLLLPKAHSCSKIKTFGALLVTALSMVCIQLSAGIAYLIGRKAHFYVTNENTIDKSKWAKYMVEPNSVLTTVLNVLFAICLFICGICAMDFSILMWGLTILGVTVLSFLRPNLLNQSCAMLGNTIFAVCMAQVCFGNGFSLIAIYLYCSLPLLIV
ncbi:MAG: glycosyltransferase family 2 protein [Sedimentisphaerales bacterium]